MYVLCGALCMMMMAFEIDENFTKINMALVLRVRTVYAHTLNSWHNQPEPIGVITFCGENIIRLLNRYIMSMTKHKVVQSKTVLQQVVMDSKFQNNSLLTQLSSNQIPH